MKQSKIKQRMKAHINKHHREASKGPDHLEEDMDGAEIASVDADSTAAGPGDVLVTGESEHGSVGSSAIIDDPKSSGVAEAPETCKFKDCEFVVSGLKRSKIEQRMKAHINKHHGEASKGPDHLEKAGPIAEINADKEASDHGLSCKECGKLYMGPNKVFALMRHQV